MVPISEPNDLQDRGTTAALKRRRHGHGDNNFCVVGCRTTPWYGAAGIAQHPLHSAQCSEPVADVTLFRRNKSPKIHQPRFEGSSGLNPLLGSASILKELICKISQNSKQVSKSLS